MARKHSKKGTEKHLNWQCKQCTREREPKVDGTEERVPAGVYRNASTAARETKERIVLERGQWSKTGGKKGGKGQEKGGKGDTRVCWSCGKTGHIAANCTKTKTKETSARKCMKTKMSCMRGVCWEESENEQWQ